MDNETFIANCIITVMQDDPSKIVMCRQAAEAMPMFDGETIQQIIAEEALHNFKVNAESFPELKVIDENKVLDLLEQHIKEAGW